MWGIPRENIVVILRNTCVVGLCCGKICAGVCVRSRTAVCGDDYTKASTRARTFREDGNYFMISNEKLSNTVEVFQLLVIFDCSGDKSISGGRGSHPVEVEVGIVEVEAGVEVGDIMINGWILSGGQLGIDVGVEKFLDESEVNVAKCI